MRWERAPPGHPRQPTHEYVEIAGRGVRFFDLRVGASEPGRWREVEGSRIGVWRAAGVATLHRPSYGEVEGSVEKGRDLFLTAEGEPLRATGAVAVLSVQAGGRGRRRLVLPRGRAVETVKMRGYLQVADSTEVTDPDAPKPHFDRSFEDPLNLVRAVAAILGDL